MCNSNGSKARSPVKIIGAILKREHPVMCLATMPYVYTQLCMHLLVVNSDRFQILQLHALTQAIRSYALLAGVTGHATVK